MDIFVSDRRRHREIAKRRGDETEGIERPEPCPCERCRQRQPAVELEIEHPAQTGRTAPAATRQRTVDPIGQRRTRERERPRDPRRVAPSITRPRERGRGDDRSAEPSAERERINSVQVLRLAVFVAPERSRDQDLLEEKGSECGRHESRATPAITPEWDRREQNRNDPTARDTDPSCAHACA